MKQLTAIFLISLLGSNIFPQPFGDALPEYQISRIDYENSSGAKENTVFQYDRENKIFKAIWTAVDKPRYSINYYEYDSGGNLISAFRDFSDGITSFERFDYDPSGNKVSEYFYRSDSVAGYALHVYNGNQLIKSDLFNYKGWLSGNLEFQYNSRKKKERGFILSGNDTICKVLYDYDNIGNLIREFWNFNGKWSQTFNYTYQRIALHTHYYSSPFLSGKSNFRISRETYTYNDENGGPSVYYYNGQNQLTRKDFIRSDNLKTSTVYEYDTEGKLISSKRTYSDNSIDIFTYIYDENKNLVLRNCFKADTLYGFESYLYDSNNALIKAYLKNFDGWLSGTINYKTDESGKISTGEFSGENGFNASIIFNYNPENLISKIRWTFTFGKFQEYNFEYEYIGPINFD